HAHQEAQRAAAPVAVVAGRALRPRRAPATTDLAAAIDQRRQQRRLVIAVGGDRFLRRVVLRFLLPLLHVVGGRFGSRGRFQWAGGCFEPVVPVALALTGTTRTRGGIAHGRWPAPAPAFTGRHPHHRQPGVERVVAHRSSSAPIAGAVTMVVVAGTVTPSWPGRGLRS